MDSGGLVASFRLCHLVDLVPNLSFLRHQVLCRALRYKWVRILGTSHHISPSRLRQSRMPLRFQRVLCTRFFQWCRIGWGPIVRTVRAAYFSSFSVWFSPVACSTLDMETNYLYQSQKRQSDFLLFIGSLCQPLPIYILFTWLQGLGLTRRIRSSQKRPHSWTHAWVRPCMHKRSVPNRCSRNRE